MTTPLLNILIVSWCPSDRPARIGFLDTTLRAIFARLDEEPDLPSAVHLVDNGSCPEALAVIDTYRDRLATVHIWPKNRGINQAYETLMAETPPTEYTAMCDADIEIFDRFSFHIEMLRERPDIGASCVLHSPEHDVIDMIRVAGRGWLVKKYERGTFMMFRTAELEEMRPFPIHDKTNWDWWVCQSSRRSVEKICKRIAVLPAGARHLGWRGEDSTWLGRHREWAGMYPELPTDQMPSPTKPEQPEDKRTLHDVCCSLTWNAPDIREHLGTFVRLARQVKSAATLGHDVSTAIAFLEGGIRDLRNYHFDDRTDVAIRKIKFMQQPNFQWIQCDVLNTTIEETDLLAIDSVHTYEQLRQELALHAPKVRCVITMHDTSLFGEVGEDGGPGMQMAIDEFLRDNKEWRLAKYCDFNNGLTVLARCDWKGSV